MTCNSNPFSGLQGMQECADAPDSRQPIDAEEVMLQVCGENSRDSQTGENPHPILRDNPNADNSLRGIEPSLARSEQSKALALNYLRREGLEKNDTKMTSKTAWSNAISKNQNELAPFVRWCKFNLVGAMGIVVQFAALFILRGVLHFNYLLATAFAVEAAVMHNFVWHEQFTWADRIWADRISADRISADRISADRISADRIWSDRIKSGEEQTADSGWWRGSRRWTQISSWQERRSGATSLRAGALMQSLRRFVRFNLANGGVSIVGNLALMKVLVGAGHVNYLLANGIAITLCSLANFLVSDAWVFGADGEPAPMTTDSSTIDAA